jgi:arginine decarboxylase
MLVPSKIFFTKGVGVHKDKLACFERALRDAGIEKCNLVYVSSILPPNCKIVSKEEGLKLLKPGQITFCVMARTETNEPNRLVASAIGVAVPKDSNNYGYLSEHHGFGEKGEKAGEYAEDLAATMLATTLGVEFDHNQAWDEREQIYKSSGHIYKTTNICQSAEGNKDGLWTTAIAVAVLILEESHVPQTILPGASATNSPLTTTPLDAPANNNNQNVQTQSKA